MKKFLLIVLSLSAIQVTAKSNKQPYHWNACMQSCTQGGGSLNKCASECNMHKPGMSIKQCKRTCKNRGGMFMEAYNQSSRCFCKPNTIEEWCNISYQCGPGNPWGWPTTSECKAKCRSVWGRYF
jgi:hypothetical protein